MDPSIVSVPALANPAEKKNAVKTTRAIHPATGACFPCDDAVYLNVVLLGFFMKTFLVFLKLPKLPKRC